MKNSAHDDIRLTISSDDIPKFATLLATTRFGQQNDAINLVSLIDSLGKANGIGEATIQNITIELVNVKAEIKLSFNMYALQDPGWLQLFESEEREFNTQDEISALCSALASRQFSLSFSPQEFSGMSFSSLLENLDLFTIGRPSSLPSVLSDLVKLRMIELDSHSDEVKLTSCGLDTLTAIKSSHPKITSGDLSVLMTCLQQQIESGKVDIENALAKLLSTITVIEQPHMYTQGMWHDIDELYNHDEDDKVVQQKEGIIKYSMEAQW
ncbi:hypothetical protein MHN79_13510 [Vibrio sp. Of14-4]|uniref:hypothetical protein n=1 Tax=Vibrio sp. Of14-4 TaxID=2724878 RepID=UPI001EF371D6|nr:hypothetical protein [Vibrio sp. Of14-4]MCG7490507.1 hypothetical protein [Vibrio sp. Of14-4]